jgi:hypothetical protein
MRTKSLLIAAAALVAGLVSVQAQSNVYSLNIVGYVNEIYAGNAKFTLAGQPLDDGNGNNLTNLFASLPKGANIQFWNGTGYTPVTKGATWGTNFVVPPGTAFFVRLTSTTPSYTNTFVGTINNAKATNSFVLNTFALVCSPLPIGGDLTNQNNTNFNLSPTLAKGSTIQVWDQTLNAGNGGFVSSVKGSTPYAWGTNLNLNVGQGFFVNPKNTTNWVQTLVIP